MGERILSAGKAFGLMPVAVGGARRIEAGLLNAGTDFDASVTPFAAGLGGMVALDKHDFIGKAALLNADRRCRTWGVRVAGGVARLGQTVAVQGASAGQVCSSAWSPFQHCGVVIVRLDDPALGPVTLLDVECDDGKTRRGETCALPMYDRERLIPRGMLVDIPELRDGEKSV